MEQLQTSSLMEQLQTSSLMEQLQTSSFMEQVQTSPYYQTVRFFVLETFRRMLAVTFEDALSLYKSV